MHASKTGSGRVIAIANSEPEILACYAVMVELRPHLSQHDFVAIVQRLARRTAFQLAYLSQGGIKAVAGFRISEWLAGGTYLEIEDLVTKSDQRSKGFGGELFDWLVDHAARNECNHLRLVSNVIRTDAHRFYIRKGMTKEAFYFSLKIGKPAPFTTRV